MGPIKQQADTVRRADRQTPFINTRTNWNDSAINQHLTRRRGTNAGIKYHKWLFTCWHCTRLVSGDVSRPTYAAAPKIVSQWSLLVVSATSHSWSAAGRRPWMGSAERTEADVARQSRPPPRMRNEMRIQHNTMEVNRPEPRKCGDNAHNRNWEQICWDTNLNLGKITIVYIFATLR